MTLPINAPLAWQAHVGMELDPVQLGSPRQIVTNVDWRNVDDIPTLVTVVTDYGEWTFRRDQHMTFPRRQDGIPRDWRRESIPPIPPQLCVMDILHPAEFEPTGMNEQQTKMWRLSMAQTVTGLWISGSASHAVIKTYTALTKQLRQWHFGISELVMFPRPVNLPARVIDRSHEAYGPYQYKKDPDIFVEFYVHPTGKGRWPSEYEPFTIPTTPGTHKMRPPSFRGDWDQFRLVERGKTHPNDPVFFRRGKKTGRDPRTGSFKPETWRD